MKNDISAKGFVTAESRRNLNVEKAVDELESAVSSISEAIAALEDFLAPLLASIQSDGEWRSRPHGDSSVGERILVSADIISNRAIKIRELIERL